MIARGFTVEQMVEIVRAGLVRRRRAMQWEPGGAPSGTRPAHHHEDLAADTTAGEPRAMKVYLDKSPCRGGCAATCIRLAAASKALDTNVRKLSCILCLCEDVRMASIRNDDRLDAY